jgi:hypothetical protein
MIMIVFFSYITQLIFFPKGGNIGHMLLLFVAWAIPPLLIRTVNFIELVRMSDEEFDHKYNGGPAPTKK